MAIVFTDEERTYDNILYRKLTSVHRDMLRRCYNKDHKNYHIYGGAGVTVCEEWQTLEGFLNTVDLVEGWDEQRYIKERLELDKDIKVPGNKIYSPSTCMFVTREENALAASLPRMKEFEATSPEGVRYIALNREEFCREHNLSPPCVHQCLQGKNKHHHNWTFRYTDGSTPKWSGVRNIHKTKVAEDPEGNVYEFVQTRAFAREHNLHEGEIAQVLRGKKNKHKGWKFYLKENYM